MKFPQENVDMVVGILKCIGNESRLKILCLLSEGEHNVNELQQILDMGSQSSISQHLNKLREMNMVEGRRDGQFTYYSISDPRILNVMMTLKENYCPDHC